MHCKQMKFLIDSDGQLIKFKHTYQLYHDTEMLFFICYIIIIIFIKSTLASFSFVSQQTSRLVGWEFGQQYKELFKCTLTSTIPFPRGYKCVSLLFQFFISLPFATAINQMMNRTTFTTTTTTTPVAALFCTHCSILIHLSLVPLK